MSRNFLKKDINLTTFVFSLIVVLLAYLCLIPLIFKGLIKIPNGIALGALINAFAYLVMFLIKDKEERELTIKFSVIASILRFVLLVGAIILFAILEYKLGMGIFNPIAIAGGYMIPLIIQIICSLVFGEKNVRREN
ncbi:MAG: hypothetical protein IKB70_11440 [Bacilli bacterium]|nr:hypothetical protein [Bacilli bacterium]